jgi:hypothetical protein
MADWKVQPAYPFHTGLRVRVARHSVLCADQMYCLDFVLPQGLWHSPLVSQLNHGAPGSKIERGSVSVSFQPPMDVFEQLRLAGKRQKLEKERRNQEEASAQRETSSFV